MSGNDANTSTSTSTNENPDNNSAVGVETFSRDDIRSAILDQVPEFKVIPFGKVKVECRQPSLAELLAFRSPAAGEDGEAPKQDKNFFAKLLIPNVFVPGTDEHVFEEADAEAIMELKFTKDMKRLIDTINAMMGDDTVQSKIEDNTKSPAE